MSRFGTIGPNWSVVGQRDFNGDGYGDMLWRDTAGNLGMWLMKSGQIAQSGSARRRSTQLVGRRHRRFQRRRQGRHSLAQITMAIVGIWFMNGTTGTSKPPSLANMPRELDRRRLGHEGQHFPAATRRRAISRLWVMNGGHVEQSGELRPATAELDRGRHRRFRRQRLRRYPVARQLLGDVAIWLMNGTQVMSIDNHRQRAGSTWSDCPDGRLQW